MSLDDAIKKPERSGLPERYKDSQVMDSGHLSADLVVNNSILNSIENNNSADEILRSIMVGFAEEQYSLKDLRTDPKNKDKDTSHISVKRGTLLKYMSETILHRQNLSITADDLNIRGRKFKEVFKLLLDMIKESFNELNMPQEQVDIFFQTFFQKMEGWEEKADKVIKSLRTGT